MVYADSGGGLRFVDFLALGGARRKGRRQAGRGTSRPARNRLVNAMLRPPSKKSGRRSNWIPRATCWASRPRATS